MKLSLKTLEYQTKLANYCRTGELEEIPGITPKRIEHYRRLVRNVINNTLIQAFPISHKILEGKTWTNLVDDFFAKHDSKVPQVWKMPYEFYLFVREKGYAKTLSKPWINDLLLFEWMEIEVHTMPDIQPGPYSEKGSYETYPLVFNSEHKFLSLEYPVHLINAEKSTQKKGKYFVLIFRHPTSKNVHFMNLGLFPSMLIKSLINENTLLLDEAIQKTAKAVHIDHSLDLKEKILPILHDMKKQGFLLGFSTIDRK